MNGPKPVWIFATNRLSPSSPRPASAASSGPGLLLATATKLDGSFMLVDRRRRGRRRHGRGPGRPGLVFRSGRDLGAVESEPDGPRPSERPEIECFPGDRDLAAADPEKPAEIDHRRARLAVRIDQYVHDETQILPGRPFDLLAQQCRHFGRWQRLDI